MNVACDVSVRTATEADFPSISALYAEVDAQHSRALPQTFKSPAVPGRSPQFLRQMISAQSTTLLVAEEAGQLLGLIEASVRDAAPLPMLVSHRFGAIATVVVRSETQGKGVGRALVRAAERWASSRGASEVEIIVYEFNESAVSFYERLGYRTASRRMNRSLGNGDASD